MTTTERVAHLDQMLTGIAMYEAYANRDTETLTGLTGAIPPAEAVTGLLAAMEVMTGVFATQLRTDPAYITDSVRRRIVREIAVSGGEGSTP